MGKVYNQLTDRNLSEFATNPKLPYNIRKMAAKILEDRRKAQHYAEMAK